MSVKKHFYFLKAFIVGYYPVKFQLSIISGSKVSRCGYIYPSSLNRSVPKTRAPRALRAHELARAYVPTRLTRLRALSRAL